MFSLSVCVRIIVSDEHIDLLVRRDVEWKALC